MIKLLRHKFKTQEVFTTKGLQIQIDDEKPVPDEVYVPNDLVDEVFKNPKRFTIKNKKLFDKKAKKEVKSI